MLLPQVALICYVEPFCGAAWIFFKKPESKVEVLNDVDNNIVNLYRVIQHHPEEFLRQFKTLFISRRIFDLLMRHDDECLTDIHRAVKWFYILRVSFAAQMVNGGFGYSSKQRPRLSLLDLEETLLKIHWRLGRVYIENKAYGDVIRRYDRPHTFFYIDPPHYGMKVCRFNFEQGDFARLAEILSGLKGKFLMSLNDHKEVRRIFNGFRILAVPTKYSSMNARHKGRKALSSELLIRNY